MESSNDEPLFLLNAAESQNVQNERLRNELNEMRSQNEQILADDLVVTPALVSNGITGRASHLHSILKTSRRSPLDGVEDGVTIAVTQEGVGISVADAHHFRDDRKVSLSGSEKSGSYLEQISVSSKNTNLSISSHLMAAGGGKYFTYSPSSSSTKLNMSSNSIQPSMVIIGRLEFI
jgi:hypothetical protein